jgi:lipoate-protein ligase A
MTNLLFSEKLIDKGAPAVYNGNMKFIIRSNTTDPYINLAAEEYLTKRVRRGEPILFLWQNADTVVIGKNQNSRAECDLERMKEDGVLLSRRLSGGGAVYHDAGNLCFSFISHEDDHDVAAQLAMIADACAEFGIDARPTGRNDIEADGRKFSGNAFYTIDKNKCHHGTVLIASDIGKLSNYLTVSKTKLEAKGIKSVRSRVVNLSEMNPNITPALFADALASGFSSRPMPEESLYRDRAEFFASREWLFDSDPEFTDEIKYRTSDGEFTLKLKVKSGIVTDCRVYTDSHDQTAAERIRAEVMGRKFEEVNSWH